MIVLNHVFVKKFKRIILQDISFSINKNDTISLIGKNGAGKSSICKLIIGSQKPTKGKIIKDSKLRIAYVPQIFNKNIHLPLLLKDFLLMGLAKTSGITNDMQEMTEKLDLTNKLNVSLVSLSGGELQKSLLIRALLRKPQLLILDEAFSFIDLSSISVLHKLIFDKKIQLGFALLLVSHDINFVLKNTSQVICLKDGAIHCKGNQKDISSTPFIENLIQTYNHHSKGPLTP